MGDQADVAHCRRMVSHVFFCCCLLNIAQHSIQEYASLADFEEYEERARKLLAAQNENACTYAEVQASYYFLFSHMQSLRAINLVRRSTLAKLVSPMEVQVSTCFVFLKKILNWYLCSHLLRISTNLWKSNLGICFGCSMNCHDGHELVEMYTKRRYSYCFIFLLILDEIISITNTSRQVA